MDVWEPDDFVGSVFEPWGIPTACNTSSDCALAVFQGNPLLFGCNPFQLNEGGDGTFCSCFLVSQPTGPSCETASSFSRTYGGIMALGVLASLVGLVVCAELMMKVHQRRDLKARSNVGNLVVLLALLSCLVAFTVEATYGFYPVLLVATIGFSYTYPICLTFCFSAPLGFVLVWVHIITASSTMQTVSMKQSVMRFNLVFVLTYGPIYGAMIYFLAMNSIPGAMLCLASLAVLLCVAVTLMMYRVKRFRTASSMSTVFAKFTQRIYTNLNTLRWRIVAVLILLFGFIAYPLVVYVFPVVYIQPSKAESVFRPLAMGIAYLQYIAFDIMILLFVIRQNKKLFKSTWVGRMMHSSHISSMHDPTRRNVSQDLHGDEGGKGGLSSVGKADVSSLGSTFKYSGTCEEVSDADSKSRRGPHNILSIREEGDDPLESLAVV